jgi:hypothetical protein
VGFSVGYRSSYRRSPYDSRGGHRFGKRPEYRVQRYCRHGENEALRLHRQSGFGFERIRKRISFWLAIDNAVTVGTAISKVDVFVDGIKVGNATYGSARPDVCAVFPARPGCPYVGWIYPLDTTSLALGLHTIRVAATNSDANPPGTSYTETSFTVASMPILWIDAPAAGFTVSGTVNVSGWAIDTNPTTALSKVEVFVDGDKLGAATYGSSRPDVCAVFPGRVGCPYVGWSFPLNTTALSVGAHVLRVTTTDTNGKTAYRDIGVTVNR